LLTGRVVSFCGEQGLDRGRWSSPWPEVRRGRVGEFGGRRDAERHWKSGEGRTRLYIWPSVGLADEIGSDEQDDGVWTTYERS
jgi:hypothetical protein